MSVGDVLLDILVVLIAAKLAAEVAERIGLPAVVGEILAGILIGPSVLGFVGGDDEVLRVLAEIGVILLLLEVGLQLDLQELGAVGRASLLVAMVGVAAPFALGMGAAEMLGHGGNTALFVGAALTATSVGITARVFGDLRVLTGAEARTVLGAAVVDDVIGLVILTVVVRIVTEGSVSLLTVAGVIAVAVAFLVVAGIVGVRVAPPLFRFLHRVSRSPGTLVALALAFALVFAELASAAKLAPIVGAFVAGLALARSDQSERIRRELTPVGHLFVPVFFLQIGIDTDVGAFAQPAVLTLAGALLLAAVIGKLVCPIGAIGSPGDKLLIGLGMLPRGEVGLIFAGIGLREGILGQDIYAALLIVVLATTLATPSALRWRLLRMQRATRQAPPARTPEPPGGWLQAPERPAQAGGPGPERPARAGGRADDGAVDLAGVPGDHLVLRVALEASLLVARARPGPRLLDWLASVRSVPLRWDRDTTRLLFRVLTEGDVRSWRFLEASGVLEAALPEMAETVRRRRSDPFELDPTNILRWSLVERVRDLGESDPLASAEVRQLEHPEWLLLAALILETAGGASPGPERPLGAGSPGPQWPLGAGRTVNAPVEVARRVVKRLDLGAAAEQEIALLVGEVGLLRAAARRPDGLTEGAVLPIALHLDKPERARALYLLSLAVEDLDPGQRRRLDQLCGLLQSVLAQEQLTGRQTRNLVERRRAEAARLAGDDAVVRRRIQAASIGYVLAQDAPEIARQVGSLDPLPATGRVRVAITALSPGPESNGRTGQGEWRVDVVGRDRVGMLATVTDAMTRNGLAVVDAVLATWPDGAALESFRVRAVGTPSPEALQAEVEAGFGLPLAAVAVPDATVEFDPAASPWYTLCQVRAPDRAGLLHSVAVAFAVSRADVHTALVRTQSDVAIDRFELTDGRGNKLDPGMEAAIRGAIASGVTARGRRAGGRARAVNEASSAPCS